VARVAKRTGAAAVPVAAVAAVAAELPRHRAVCPSNPRIRPSLAVLISEAYSDAGTRAPGTWPFVLTLAIDLSGRTVTTLAVAAERTSAVPAVAAAAVPMGMMRADGKGSSDSGGGGGGASLHWLGPRRACVGELLGGSISVLDVVTAEAITDARRLARDAVSFPSFSLSSVVIPTRSLLRFELA